MAHGRPNTAAQAAGCFLQLVFAALLAVGAVTVAPEAAVAIGEGEAAEGLTLLAYWLGGPAAGLGVTALAMRAFNPRRGRDQKRRD